ncbi:hypothetical protein [Pseudomonas alliivorans]|uniref:hypothetical protein n=1 Tax=Pseudomonas alliivorans TaxID=2810613 RepID=UPI002ED5041F|nr:hypothetical protein [Pseudomonas alliivorans]
MEPYLPVTVLCAIGLFVTKEVVEHLKKRAEKKRKVEAYKTLIAEECMKNAWALKSLRSQIRAFEDPNIRSVRVESTSYGDILVTVYDHESWGGSPIVDVHSAIFEKTVVDLAVIDAVLFSHAKDAYESLAEVTNCLSQLREFAGKNDLLHLDGLASYAKDVVNDADSALKSLFKFCTGKALSHKIRSFI